MPTAHRRAFRHAVALPCQVVRERDFRLIADVSLDLSTGGMLVPTSVRVLTGEPVLVSFRAPGEARWLDSEAVVARVVHGRRPEDRGRMLGLSFQGLDDEDRQILFRQLRAAPPSGRAAGQRERRTGAWG